MVKKSFEMKIHVGL